MQPMESYVKPPGLTPKTHSPFITDSESCRVSGSSFALIWSASCSRHARPRHLHECLDWTHPNQLLQCCFCHETLTRQGRKQTEDVKEHKRIKNIKRERYGHINEI